MSLAFDPAQFVDEIAPKLREAVKDGVALAAVSGGVDSTTAAALAYKVLGPEKVVPVMIDTGFLRLDEAKRVKEMLKGVMELRVVDESERFLKAVEGLADAEEKRKAFRKTFYDVLAKVAKEVGAKYLIQGTIAADWVETQGGIKTQHNVLVQVGIDPEREWGFTVVEPLVDLYKNEVRVLAKYLGLPDEIAFRQPFPGPGLLVRTVGLVTREKLEVERMADWEVENGLKGLNYSQYFAVTFDSSGDYDEALSREVNAKVFVYNTRATGVKGDVRAYGRIARVDSDLDYDSLREAVAKLTKYDITHVVVKVKDGRADGKYSVAIRAVITQDFMTADFAPVPRDVLYRVAERISRIDGVKEVLYDVTSKPPATIEYE
ncbi:MAG: ATP-binding protein [Thermoprotei archaeon]